MHLKDHESGTLQELHAFEAENSLGTQLRSPAHRKSLAEKLCYMLFCFIAEKLLSEFGMNFVATVVALSSCKFCLVITRYEVMSMK